LGKCRGTVRLASITVSPSGQTVAGGATQQYTVSGTKCDGTTTAVVVAWTCTGGTIDGTGLFTAGTTSGNFTVTATTTSGPTFTSSVPVTVAGTAATLVSITVFDSPQTVVAGRQLTFSDFGTLSDGTHNQPSVVWTTDDPSGTIVSTGAATALYTAGSTPGNYKVFSTSGAIVGTGFVTVNPAATLASITVAPNPLNTTPGAITQFTHTDKLSDGTSTTVVVVWSATGGTIDQTGKFTAGNTSGTFAVTATNGSISGSASVTVNVVVQNAPTAVIKNPVAGFAYTSGTLVTLDPSGSFSSGTTTWSAKWQIFNSSNVLVFDPPAGTDSVSNRPVWTTPSVTDTFKVTLQTTDSLGNKSSLVFVTGTVSPATKTLQSISVSPTLISMIAGQTQQFTAQGQNTDGSAVTSPSVTWTATGGSITTGGIFTAGSTPGTYSVKATSTVNTAISGNATVSITNPLVSISISPAAPSVQEGASEQFTATGHFTDGSTGSVSVVWTATGGTITASGFYTAGSTAGGFAVSATNTASGIVGSTSITVTAPTSNTGAGAFDPGYPRVAVCAFTDNPNTAVQSCGSAGMVVGTRGFTGPGTPSFAFTTLSLISDPTAPSPLGHSCWRAKVPAGTLTSVSNYAARFSKDCSLPTFLKMYTRMIMNFGGTGGKGFIGNNKILMMPSGNNFNINILLANSATAWPNASAALRIGFARPVWNPDGSLNTNAGTVVNSNQSFSAGSWLDIETRIASSSLGGTDATLQVKVNGTLLTWGNWSSTSGGPSGDVGNSSGILSGFTTRTSLNPGGFNSNRETIVNGGGNGPGGSLIDAIFDTNLIYVGLSN